MPLISFTIGGSTSSSASTRLSPSRWISASTVRLRSCESEPPVTSGTPSMRASWRRRATVLISPLCPSTPNGCTRRKLGQVFVE